MSRTIKLTFYFLFLLGFTTSFAGDGPWDNPPKPVKSFDTKWQGKSISLTKFITITLDGKAIYRGIKKDREDDSLDDNWHSFAVARLKDKAILKVIWSDEVDLYMEKFFIVPNTLKGKVPQSHQYYGHNGHYMFIHNNKIHDYRGECWMAQPCHDWQKLFVLNEKTNKFDEVKILKPKGEKCLPADIETSCKKNRLKWEYVKATPLNQKKKGAKK